jgi:hypothetical protein
MLELMPNDLAAVSSVTEGTVRWCPGDAYSQALENKPEYAGRVRQVGPGVLPVWGSTQTYYTPSQSRTQNTSDSSHMAERIRELEMERDQQRARIQELEDQMGANEARFQRLEAFFFTWEFLFISPRSAQKWGSPRRRQIYYLCYCFYLC